MLQPQNENLRVIIDNQETRLAVTWHGCLQNDGPDTDTEHHEDFEKVVNVLSEESEIDEKTIKVNID